MTRVIIPASVTDIYTDMRILLGWAWTYLIVAEVVGTMSGITLFINQQARYRNFDNVYAAIAMIGIIGLSTDMFLAWLGTLLFPWKRRTRSGSSKFAALVKLLPKSPVPAIPEVPPVKTVEQKSAAELNVAQ
jgi:NitT/TauT family transport system permease protein